MVNFTVIGTNFITDRFLTAAKLCKEFNLYGVYSRNKERAEEYAFKWNAQTAYTNLDDMAADSQIQAVYIASPTSCHAVQAIKMMEAGKHVLCEKPIASNKRELDEMIQTANNNHVILLEAMRPIFTPGMEAVQNNLHKLGTIRRVHFTFCQYSSRYDKFKNQEIENAFRPELSNGSLMDIGSYCVCTAAYLFGKPSQVLAMGIRLKDSIDGIGTILAGYEGFLAEFVYSKITDSLGISEIQGEEGCMTISKISEPDEINITYRNGKTECIFRSEKKEDMIFELERFLNLLSHPQEISQYRRASEIAMDVMDEARRQIGVVYPADLEI